MDVADVNLNRNIAIAAKKISEKYRHISRKRKRVTVEPTEEIREQKRAK